MGQPAARLTDMHVCPMVTPGVPPIPHVGGPITGPGCPTVLIAGVPAAVVGDMCVCVGPPDSIIKGSMGVFFGGKPAARMGDSTAHGGTIVIGCPTVLIGDAGGGGGAVMVTPGMIEGLDISIEILQSMGLKNAANKGTPFNEVCAKKKQVKEEQEQEEEKEEPELLECYFENEDGDVIEDIPEEGDVFLVIKSSNMSGEKVDIDLSDNSNDFKYKGHDIKDDILKDISITGDEQKVKLEVNTSKKST